MKLKENEEVIHEYYFSRSKDTFSKGVLTNNRLIYISKKTKDSYKEENYPLSKLTSITVENEKNNFRSKVLGFSVLFGVTLIVYSGNLILSGGNMDVLINLIPLFLILVWLVRFGLKPDKIITNIVISQMAGVKKITTQNNNDLEKFIDRINEQLN